MRNLLIYFLIFCSIPTFSQIWKNKSNDLIGIMNAPNPWADSVFQSLTLEQRIGQLFMVAAYSNISEDHEAKIDSLIRNQHIGGIIFMQGKANKQALLTNHYQSISTTPLMIGMDAEWGLGMRLTGIKDLPRSMAVGAIGDDLLAYELGRSMGRQCNILGVHVNFAPVMDINNNPENPVINFRSFGEDKFNVTRKALAIARGLQEEKVMACSKHFPGHGDTNIDSHEDLPTIHANLERIDSLELFPFKEAVKKGIGATMVAHLNIPELNEKNNLPTTLSSHAIQDLLKNELKFKGLIFTDALNMKGIANYYTPGELEVKALQAGNDVLLFSENVPLAIREILKAIQNGTLSQKEIDEKVKKILRFKSWAGLSNVKKIDTTNLEQILQPEINQEISRSIYEEAITLVKNEGHFLPIQPQESSNLVCILVGNVKNQEVLIENINLSGRSKIFQVDWKIENQTLKKIKDSLDCFGKVQFIVQPQSQYPKNKYGMNDALLKWMKEVSEIKPTGVMILGNAYCIKFFDSTFQSIAVVYENTPMAQLTAIQGIFGQIAFKGALPISVGKYSNCSGICIPSLDLPSVGRPLVWFHKYEQLNHKIDSIVNIGLQQNAYPGCQVIVIHHNRIVHRKNYGYFDYSKKQPVLSTTLYDLASVTKVASTTNLLMLAKQDQKFDYLDSLGKLESKWIHSNKSSITMAEWMTHQAGLTAFIPFHQNWKFRNASFPLISDTSNDTFSLEIAKNIWGNQQLPTLILDSIIQSPIHHRGEYKYSDLGYSIGQNLLESWYHQPINLQFEEKIALPLGLKTTTFLPLQKFPLNQIAPTEDDKTFRNQIVQGYVHDQTAALKGGIAGHAGLFSNAADLSKIGFFWMKGGQYASQEIIQKSILHTFSQPYLKGNRRGLCFDKPAVGQSGGPCSKSTPASVFGHTGFTGTCIWVDPENEWVFVFLSNRVHPIAEVNKLASLNIRTLIQEELYQFKTSEVGEKVGKLPKQGSH